MLAQGNVHVSCMVFPMKCIMLAVLRFFRVPGGEAETIGGPKDY